MMKLLRTLRQFTWYQLLFIGAVSTLILSVALQAITPRQVELQELLTQNYDGSTTTFKSIEYTGEIFEAPQSLAVGRVQERKINMRSLILQLTDLYNLQQDSDRPFLWQNSEYALTGTEESTQVTLVRIAEEPLQPITLSTAERIAEAEVAKIYPSNSLEPDMDSVEYYGRGESHPETVQPSNAQQIRIPFITRFQNYPVLLTDAVLAPIYVTVSGNQEVQKIEISAAYVEVSETDTFASIPVSQALQNIEQGYGAIIAQSFYGHGDPALSEITQAIFTDASIEYRADTVSDTVIPYYHFVGQLTNTENQTFTGHVITPAVQTDFSQR